VNDATLTRYLALQGKEVHTIDFGVNADGRQAWLKQVENNKMMDDRGNFFQLTNYNDYVAEYPEIGPKSYVEFPDEFPLENQNHLLTGTAWVSDEGMVLYTFDEDELSIHLVVGGRYINISRSPYAYYNNEIFL
jgi:hypothetical protein